MVLIRKNISDICEECGGKIILNGFEKTCSRCGLVCQEVFSDSSFMYNNVEDRNTTTQYVSLGNRINFVGGLGTFIDFENSKYLKDKSGKILSPKDQRLYRRLKKNYAQFIRIKDSETEFRIFNILNKITLYLGLNQAIRNNAAYYYRKIVKNEEKIINNISLIAFCIFNAVRKENHNAPITINEISKAFQNFGHRVNPRLILRDGLLYKNYLTNNSLPHKSEDYLIRLINNVMNHNELEERLRKKQCIWKKGEFENKILKKCRWILKELTKWERGGRNPFILAGAVIYLADKLIAREFEQKAILTQKIISEATKIAEYSIRDHYVNLLKPIFIK